MKKTTVLIILGVITVFCIIYGSVKHLGGGFKAMSEWSAENGVYEDSKDRTSFNQNLEAFSAIEIDSSIAEIRIEEGNSFKIEGFYTGEFLQPTISVNNGKLDVRQQKKNSPHIMGGSYNCRILVTVPAGTKLEAVRINSNVGDLKIREITAGAINLNMNVGEVSVRKATFDNIEVSNNVGEISIEPIDNVDNYEISVSTNLGSVNVNGRNYKRSYTSKTSSRKTIKASTNIGEVRVR